MTTSVFLSPAHLPPLLAQIIGALCKMVAASGQDRSMVPLVVAAWSRLQRTAREFERLVARVLAGRAAPVRRAGLTRSSAVRDAGAFRLPRAFGWLGQAVAETRQLRTQVEMVLADPAMMALLAAEPKAVRILRPLCRMLGIEQGLAGCRMPLAFSAPKKEPPVEPPSAVALIVAALMANPIGFDLPVDPPPITPHWYRSD
jgi:hypothetical protein